MFFIVGEVILEYWWVPVNFSVTFYFINIRDLEKGVNDYV